MQNSQEDTCKIDSKMNLKMNLKIDSSTVLFFSEYCKIFKNTYYIEHRQTAASTINIDTKYSLPGQYANTSINSTEKPGYQLQRRWVWVARDGQSDGTSKLWRSIKLFLLIFRPGFYISLIRMKFWIITWKRLGVWKSSSTHRSLFVTTNFPSRFFKI